VGTWNATSDNRIVALNPADGSVLWSFDNGGGSNGIGIISGGLFVDAAASRIYFASRARGSGSNHTLWCLSFTNTGATKLWSVASGDSDAAPMVYQGRVYFGNNNGEVKVFDTNTGALLASTATGDGPVKGYVIPDFTALPRKLFLATTTRVWVLQDNGSSISTLSSINTIPNPSIPLRRFGTNYLNVGGGDGKLYQVDVGSFATTSVLLPTGTQLGSPTLDTQTATVYAGTDAGTMYAVATPLP
jgi:outer membrane protein assembly factor BamB